MQKTTAMKNKLQYLLGTSLAITIMGISDLPAQTYVSGGIYTNATWTLANSPYIVNGALTLFPTDTLTIEPGVIVKFDNGIGFEVRGILMSIGTPNDSILFTSSSLNPTQGIWQGIYINNNLGASGEIRYSIFKYASDAVKNNCCWVGGPLNIRHCRFDNNSNAVSEYAGWDVIIDSCHFSNNNKAITNADKIITNSSFTGNNYGLYATERIDVYNCNFCGNQTALSGGRGNLQNTIIMNNGVGVVAFFEGFFNVSGNVIAQNDTGIILGMYSNSSPGLGSNNVICSNYFYNLINNTPLNIAVPGNCWCDTNSVTISQKIYDGYDNINLGLINFTPYLACDTSSIPDAICPNISTGIATQAPENISSRIYPNPMCAYSVLKINEPVRNAEIIITNLTGQSVLNLVNQNGSEFTLYKQNMPGGLYFLSVSEQGKTICNLKLIIL
jgi:type IX secretion system substrate protein